MSRPGTEMVREEASSGVVDGSSDSKDAGCKKNKHDRIGAAMKKPANMDIFPWVTEFRELTKSSLARTEPTSLNELMHFFNRNVKSYLNDCFKKSLRAVKLKELVKETLLLFMYYHRFQKPQNTKSAAYLEQMSDLLAMYIDLELVASKRDPEPQYSTISAKLVSCLYVYLENSTEHILDTLMKIQLLYETHCQILDPVFSKVFKIIPAHPETEIMYVRYFLVYRLWKRIHSNLAVKRQINANAISSLLAVPTNLPVTLLEQVLPNTTTTVPVESKTTKFYLLQSFDLRKSCSQFLDFCKRNKEKEDSNSTDNIIGKDARIKSNLTIEANQSTNTNFSKTKISLDKPNYLENVNNIPKIDKIDSYSTLNGSDSLKNKNLVKPTILSKKKKAKRQNEIILIDLTSPQVTKIFRRKNRRKISWLEDAKRSLDTKIKEAALKRTLNTDQISMKITENQHEDISQILTNIKNLSVEKSTIDAIHSSSNVKIDGINLSNNEDDQNEKAGSKSQIEVEKSNSSPLNLLSVEPISCDSNDASKEPFNGIKKSLKDCSIEDLSHLTVMDVTSSEALKLEEENEKICALRDDDSLITDKQTGDSAMSDIASLKEFSTLNEETFVDSNTYSVICAVPSNVIAQPSVISKVQEKKLFENTSVNPNVTKADYNPKEQKVQQILITEHTSVSSINENHSNIEKKLKEKENTDISNEEKNDNFNDVQMNEINRDKSVGATISNTELHSDNSELLTSSSDFYNIQDSEIDGLTLLAKISAQLQQVSPNKKNEIKVKPYSSLQQKPKEDNAIVNETVGNDSGNTLENVALHVEVSASKLLPNNVNKFQHPDVASSDLLPYVLDENMQYNFESNDNANVILNGETIMLMQKSPNSNLYIINKAAVDNISGSKFNYNSDEEDLNKLADAEDIKYSQQGIIIKHELDDGLRNRLIKQDPDFVDVKSNMLIHDESKFQNQSQNYDLHFAGYSVTPAGYCTYPNIHNPSTGCPCVNCTYCRQIPYYIPTTLTTQLVQTNSTVQEKRNSKKTEANEKLAKIYDDQSLRNADKNLLSAKPQQQVPTTGEQKTVISRFEHVDSKLPLKKRLKAQMMVEFDNPEPKSSLKNEIVSNTYPGMLMLSIADVEIQNEHTPLDLGAVVEVTSTSVKPTENRGGGKAKKIKNANNQNVPNSFPKKSSGKKRRLYSTDEEVENGTTQKKPRKSNTGRSKQTRSSRRIVPTVTYVYPDIDSECSPSGKRRKRRNHR